MSNFKWTAKSIIDRFITVITKKITEIENGSITFTIHFRNGDPQKVEVETKEHYGK